MEQKWVQAWGMSHAGMSLLGYRGNDRTFRLTVHSAVSGGQIRLSLSNRFSKERVRVGSAYAAVCDETGRRIGESTPLFFAGKAAFKFAPRGVLMVCEQEAVFKTTQLSSFNVA